jgi:hypothetical protein
LAHLGKIFETLRKLEIDVTLPTLGALLSEFKGLFYIYRGENGGVLGWSMNNYCDLDKQGDNENRTPPTQPG